MINEDLDSEPFIYPTIDERIKIQKSQPLLSELYLIYSEGNKRFNNASKFIREHDLSLWIERFNNKMRKLEFSYILTKFYFSRGVPDIIWSEKTNDGAIQFFPLFNEEKVRSNHFLFNYSSENFYYHFISAADLIYHILNIHYSFELKSGSQFNNQVIQKLKGKSIYKSLECFKRQTMEFRNERNDLTHNFPFNEIDLRSKQEIRDGKIVTTMGNYSYTTSGEVMVKIENAITHFASFMNELNADINPPTT